MKTVWIDVATKLAIAILATTWGVYLKRWLEKPSISKSSSSETMKARKESAFARILRYPSTMPCLLFVESIYSIYRDLQRTGPITRGAVVEISFDTGTVILAIGGAGTLWILRLMRELHESHVRSLDLLWDMKRSDQ